MDKTLKITDGWTRRKFLKFAVAGSAATTLGLIFPRKYGPIKFAETFIASVENYSANIFSVLREGANAIGITSAEINGKRVLIKPNLVEPHAGICQINTHPTVIRATVELFLHLGASEVVVAEGVGHRRDTHLILEESGVADVLHEDKIPFLDLNVGPVVKTRNAGKYTGLKELILPSAVVHADIIVSLAKMKTHHWAGVTLSMKNMFGIMPGIAYGWPKNVLHQVGLQKAILDINTTIQPHIAIVDGIVGMDGDGPIMGTPIESKVLIIGNNPAAVDATSARIMRIDPFKIPYLSASKNLIGPIWEHYISQRGEPISGTRKTFQLIDDIPAHKGIRL